MAKRSHRNRKTGKVEFTLKDGKEFSLCLTLGALAEIEESLEIDSLTQVDEVLRKGRVRDLITILIALLHGGGHTEVDRKDLISWEISLPDLMESIQEAFEVAGLNDSEGGEHSGEGK